MDQRVYKELMVCASFWIHEEVRKCLVEDMNRGSPACWDEKERMERSESSRDTRHPQEV